MRYSAITLKEIFWQGKTYKRGAPIVIIADDLDILRAAGVIGNVKSIQVPDVEFAVKAAPENAKRPHRGKRKR